MANKKLFNTATVTKVPASTARNNAGGKAYDTGAEHSLAQFACTGMLGGTFYTSAQTELKQVIDLAQKVSPEFLAKVAVYARKSGYMKDMPAVLIAVLSTRDTDLFRKAFPLVIDNGKMLSTFVQVIRSGQVGRKSLGSAPKKMIRNWIYQKDGNYLFKQSVGHTPSLTDVIKMVHPNPSDKEQELLFGYLIGKDYEPKKRGYPSLVKEFEAFKKGKPDARKVPDVPFQMLTSQNLSDKEWGEIAKNGNWHFTRMNLNNFSKHGVFNDAQLTKMIVDRLQNEEIIKKARVFPYQIFQTIRSTEGLPRVIENALHKALDISLGHVPVYNTTVQVGVDSSGSMNSAVNQAAYSHKGNPITCNEVAALFASAIFRTNESKIYRFDTSCNEVLGLVAQDSVMTNAKKIGMNGGGTDCSSFLRTLNSNNAKGDLVVLVSDNESWFSAAGHHRGWGNSGGTDFQAQWQRYKARNKNALLVCIDLTPGGTVQAIGKDVLLVGGFSDAVFDVIGKFTESRGDNTFWVKEIEKISLD